MSYSTSDLSRKSGDIIAEAMRRPVTLTQRNKPRLVLLNIEDYNRLIQQPGERNAFTIETTPPEMLSDLKVGLEAYLSGNIPSA